IGRSHRFEPRPKRKSIQMTHRSGLETNAPGSAAPFPEVAEPVLRRVQTTIISWFSTSARELPWREPGSSAQPVLVSEIMSQQTPVAGDEPRCRQWMGAGPMPSVLAPAPTAEVLYRWDRLGDPRRSLRLQESARVNAEELEDAVPTPPQK